MSLPRKYDVRRPRAKKHSKHRSRPSALQFEVLESRTLLAVGNDLFVSDNNSHNILGINPTSGVVSIAVAEADILAATGESSVDLNENGMAVDPAQNLYFTERNSDSVLKYDGSTVSVLASAADIQAVTGSFPDLRHMDININGQLFVIDRSTDDILEVDITSGAVSVFSAGSTDIDDVTARADGGLYLATDSNDAVFSVDPSGTRTQIAAGSPFSDLDVYGTLADNGDYILASDSNDTVFRITPDGNVSTFLSSAAISSLTGGSIDPEGGIEIDVFGNFYMAESATDQVLRFDTGLNGQVLATAADIQAVTGQSPSLNGDIAIAQDNFLVGPVRPNPRTEPVETIDVDFREPIDEATFDFNDITLTLDGGANLITPAVTVTPLGGNVYQIGNLSGLTSATGVYSLRVTGDGIDDAGNTPLTDKSGASGWVTDPTFTGPGQFGAVEPPGSLVYEGSLRREIAVPTDTQNLTIDLDENQRLTVLLEPAAGLQATLEVTDPASSSLGNSAASAPGETLLLQTLPVSTAGTYTLHVGAGGGTVGSFGLRVYLNSALEEELTIGTTNNTFATAQDIEASFLPLTEVADHSAVMGQVSAGTVLSIDRTGSSLRTVDLVSGQTLSSVALSLAGESIGNGVGLAQDPTTGTLYAWLKLNDNDSRVLATVDPLTGVVTQIADTRLPFAALAFDAGGNLFGVTGDNGASRQALYQVDKATGVPDFVQAFHTGGNSNSDGESLTFDPTTGLLHHVSGRQVGVINSVDPATLPAAHRGLLPSGDAYDRIRTLTFDSGGSRLLLADDDQNLFGVDPTSGAVTEIGALDHDSQGLAFAAGSFYSLSNSGTTLNMVDPADASTLSNVGVTFAGGTIEAGNGLATDPITGTLYGILSIDDRSAGRQLVSIDPGTGVATGLGNTGQLFSGIAFDNTGMLFGVTGDGAGTPSSLFSIDKTNGATQFIKAFASVDGDGEAIAFVNGTTNELFHVSGRSSSGVMQAIAVADLPAPRHTYLPIVPNSASISNNTRALTYDATGDLLLFVDSNQNLFSISPANGQLDELGSLEEDSQGLAFMGSDLYSLDRSGGQLQRIDASDGSTLSTTALVPDFNNGHALATDPVTGTLFAVVSNSSRFGRDLVTIDPTTGIVSTIGNLRDRFAALAFDDGGNLFGITGDGGATVSSLFAIDKTDASIQFLESLGGWNGGEALAFNSMNGHFYHASIEDETSLQIIDPADLPAVQPYVTLNPQPFDSTLAVFTSPDGTLFHADGDGLVSTLDPTSGERIQIGLLDHDTKGAVFLTGPETTDLFSFHLNADQPVTLGAVDVTAPFELYDANEALVATSVPSSGNLSQVISNFVPSTSGMHYVRLTGISSYSLVLTRNAAFDTEPNPTTEPQDIDATRTALGRVAGDGMIVPQGTDGTADPVTFTLNLFDGEGFEWDIQSEGSISDGTSDAYDTGLDLQGFPSQSDGVTEEAGREAVLGPDTIGDVEVTRKVYVSETLGFARFLEIIHNPTASTVNFSLELETNLGSDGGTEMVATSSGDLAFTTDDNWIITDDEDSGGDPTMLHIIANEGASIRPTSVLSNAPGDDDIDFTYDLTLAPGETQIVMHIAAQNTSRAAARRKAELLVDGAVGLGDGLTETELSQIVNFSSSSNAGDFYTFDVTAGEVIGLKTSTPAGGPLEFTNDLDPRIELYDPSGTLVDVNDNGAADGRNAVLSHLASQDGTYKARIVGSNATAGEYVVSPSASVSIEDGVLMIRGTDRDDYVTIRKSTSSYWIFANFVQNARRFRVPAADVDRVEIYAGDGNDLVRVAGDTAVMIDGGPGNDRLYGSRGNDILLGGPGHDFIRGGAAMICSTAERMKITCARWEATTSSAAVTTTTCSRAALATTSSWAARATTT